MPVSIKPELKQLRHYFFPACNDPKLLPLVRALPWTHNTIIFARCKTAQERAFYLKLCMDERYTSRKLERQIDAAQFECSRSGQQKLSAALRELHLDIGNAFRNNYVLEFLGLPDTHSENDLQKAIAENMKSFILELGKDFLFIGEEHRLQVGNQDFLISQTLLWCCITTVIDLS